MAASNSAGVRFSDVDAAILYSIPKPGVSLPELLRYYTFINRIAVPSYEVLADCLSKSVAAGVVRLPRRREYSLEDRWYEYIHQFDGRTDNEIESMLAFQELFLANDWPAVIDGKRYTLERAEYDRAVSEHQKHRDSLLRGR